ncbi:MAG TPA: AAA family ATPase [Sphingomonadaceae bacterium]|nr:AAA family ATPase [Sphingomonadaceae bacterium]
MGAKPTTTYLDHYGLSAPPFQLAPDSRFYFESRTHKKAMAYLGFGLNQGEGFIVITGDVGAGKTTLVEHLMATIDRSRLTVIRMATTQVEGDDLLRLTAQGLKIATGNAPKGLLLGHVEQALHEQARQGKRVLLIVDEAQNLPTSALEELRMLSNFQAEGKQLLQIFLLGQPEFRERLTQAPELEQLRQRVIATHHLDAMSADEVGPYIEHRLEKAGAQGRPRFVDGAYDALFRHSHGVPRRLNTLANRVLLQGSVDGLDRLDGHLIDQVAQEVIGDAAPRPRGPAADAPAPDTALVARVDELEARLEAQDAALRRVLTMLVGWVEGDRHDAGRPRARNDDF